MAKAQGKKAAAGGKAAAKKVPVVSKKTAGAPKKIVAAKKAKPPAKPAVKKAVKVASKPAPKTSAKAAKPAKAVKFAKPSKPAKAAKPAKKAVAAAKPVPKAAPKPSAKVAAKPVKSEPKSEAKKVVAKVSAKAEPAAAKPKAAKTAAVPAPSAPAAAPKPAAAPAVVDEKKRGRRARPRVHSSGAPAASWLSTEKPRPASFIAAPARAEAPSAVAAPPASSDRLIRPDDIDHPAVRTVPVRIDIEQAAGRYYVLANPLEVSVGVGEGIEWDFRYLGGADVNVEEVVVDLDKPSPFGQASFRTRKPGGARPHRQLSGGAIPAAAGRRTEYTVRAINQFKTELANTRLVLTVTA